MYSGWRQCMGETWYLACDMQMFLVSPLFIYPLWRWWKAGLAWTVFGIAALQGGLVAIFIIWDLPATSFATRSYVQCFFLSLFANLLI